MKNIDILDAVKFVCCLMICAIHSNLIIPMGERGNLLWPWLRIAVPLFFIVSSYLFFLRLKIAIRTDEDSDKIIKKWFKRNVYLYVFWFVILLPCTLYFRYQTWFSAGFAKNAWSVVRSFLLDSTFPASWFITANIFSVAVVLWLCKGRRGLSLLAGGIAGAFTVIYSSYLPLLGDACFLRQFCQLYSSLFGSPCFSFWAGLIWVVAGMILAENDFRMPRKASIPLLIAFAILFHYEWSFVASSTGNYKNDCYASLIPLCIMIFVCVKDVPLHCTFAKYLRSFSVILFVTHIPSCAFSRLIFGHGFNLQDPFGVSRFLSAMVVAALICSACFFLENRYNPRGKFLWLKYLH